METKLGVCMMIIQSSFHYSNNTLYMGTKFSAETILFACTSQGANYL